MATESKVTVRGQTTLPTPVSEALKVTPEQDSVQYEILPGRRVFITRVGNEQEDHTMVTFLRFLDADMQNCQKKRVVFSFANAIGIVLFGSLKRLIV
ncbi:antitoxin PrlF [Escherichia coli]|nr:antitoxin PrlF [Escherichia coli]